MEKTLDKDVETVVADFDSVAADVLSVERDLKLAVTSVKVVVKDLSVANSVLYLDSEDGITVPTDDRTATLELSRVEKEELTEE